MLRNRQAPSRASPQTLCQKCLKKDESFAIVFIQVADCPARHYSYECKSTVQERPYRARPSRSQQFANPKLVPKLSSDQPNELMRREGIADEQLAKVEAERKRDQEDLKLRSRSTSSSSVATISTRGSLSPERQTRIDTTDLSRKRRRGSSSSAASLATSESSRAGRQPEKDRNMRRRHSSTSPAKRGRNVHHDSSSKRRVSPRRFS